MKVKRFRINRSERTLKMKNIIVKLSKSLTAKEIQERLRTFATAFIRTKIDFGLTYIRSECQNNKIRAFFKEERFEFTVQFV